MLYQKCQKEVKQIRKQIVLSMFSCKINQCRQTLFLIYIRGQQDMMISYKYYKKSTRHYTIIVEDLNDMISSRGSCKTPIWLTLIYVIYNNFIQSTI